MFVVDDVSALQEHRRQRLCVLAATDDGELVAEASKALGLAPHEAHHPSPRRPSVAVFDDQISLVLMVLDQERTQHILRVHARDAGLLVIGSDQALEAVASDLRAVSDDPWTVLVGLVVIVARRCEEALDEIDDRCQELESQAIGYASSPQRRSMRRLRAELFRIGETQAVQRNLLSAEEELAQQLSEDREQLGADDQRLSEGDQRLGEARQRLLARAAAAFGANHSMATRLYAMLGDVLNEQDSVVSERLTLVATIFLPLTLATGFFGMNFQWMLDRLGTVEAFIAFGLVVPSLLTLATLFVIRRMTRSS